MPLIHVSLWPGRTKEQKAQLVKAITESVGKILGAPPEATTIIFQEVSKDSWANGGELFSDKKP